MRIPVIAVSDELGQLLKKRFNADVTVVPNGVDADVFYPDWDEKYLSFKDGRKVVLVFARSDYRKGFDMAVKVLLDFKNDIDRGEVSIWAVGENIEVPFKMKNFGFVSPDKLRKILSCSDVLLYPSRHEGLPLFALEAMACGCPVVTTRVVPYAEDGDNAFVADFAETVNIREKLQEALTNNALSEKVKKNGYLTAKIYDVNKSKFDFEEELKTFCSV